MFGIKRENYILIYLIKKINSTMNVFIKFVFYPKLLKIYLHVKFDPYDVEQVTLIIYTLYKI
jgi:hypothetical protein